MEKLSNERLEHWLQSGQRDLHAEAPRALVEIVPMAHELLALRRQVERGATVAVRAASFLRVVQTDCKQCVREPCARCSDAASYEAELISTYHQAKETDDESHS